MSPDSILLQRLQEAVQPVGNAIPEVVADVVAQPVAVLAEVVGDVVPQPLAVLAEGASSTVIGLAVGLSLTSVVIIGFVGFGYLLYRVSG